MRIRAAIALLALTLGSGAYPHAQETDGVRLLLARLERALQTGDGPAFLAALADSADRDRALWFIGSELIPGSTRAVIQERDRQPLAGTLPGNGFRLIVDTFAEYGSRARAATWRLDVKRTGEAGSDREWTIADEERLSTVDNLYRVSLNTSKAFAAHNLKIAAEDLDLTLPQGSVYISDIEPGVTGLVLLGRGTLDFHPPSMTEKGQLKIFCGAEALDTTFDAAFIRLNPYDYDSVIDAAALQPKTVDARELRRAQDVFREESQKSFVIDLGDLSRDAWSLLPGGGDFVAEVRTRKYDTLTYAHSSAEAEDITLFDRKRHHNIALYASKQKLATRGRFYNEDDLVDYDVLHYDIDVAASPDRLWIDGKATLRIKVRSYVLGTLSLRLADPLVVQSIVSYEYGRLFGIRVKNQNTIVVNLPTALTRDAELTVTIAYAGRLEPQTPDREALALDQNRPLADDIPLLAPEASYLYSSRSYWYPQAPVSDYATARIRLSVPPTIDCVASGELEPGFPTLVIPQGSAQQRKLYVFSATQPLRYLAFVMSRFARAETATVAFPTAGNGRPPGPDAEDIRVLGSTYRSINLSIEANPRQLQRGRDLADRAAAIALFYESLIGDAPYSSFTVALIESDLPGGHSPGYFAALNQPLPTSQLQWRNDPAAFSGFPDFFIAHELAHQWWGQAVGWRNYHEQWISEGFAQYFAALYAQRQRGDDVFAAVMRQMRKWAIDQSDQGPVYLGYRLGHIRGESRVFRALVYNKGATVLHMLRRLVGDEAFFRGLRRFYWTERFHKAGTEDFREAMEQESGQSLDRFFERWIYNATLPHLKVGYRVDGGEVVLRVEQVGEVFDVPVTIVLQYADRKAVDVLVRVHDQVVEQRAPLAGVLRGIDVNKDDGLLAEVVRN
ncbi:MAG TPA: M1 family aminopeptidase [Vicinamibacterales bacterium]|nr:M1 family aminopeptidase [Vicinamibacterales bacterium]